MMLRLLTLLLLSSISTSFIPKVGHTKNRVIKSTLSSFSIDDVDIPSDTPPLNNPTTSSTTQNNNIDDFVNDDDEIGDWKDTLDSLLSPSTPPELRVTLLRDLLSSDDEIRTDVMKAIEDRDPSMLLTSNAKALRDGTNAVAYQITNDILPSLSNPLSPTNPNELRTSVPKAASQIFNAVQTQVDNFRRGDDVADRVKEGMNVVAKSVRDAVAMEGDEGPPYEVLEKGGEFEVRKYSPYSVAETSMREVGGKWDENDVVLQGVAFNLLAGYVFGGNEERKTMELKMPVETTSLGSMRFYLGPRGDDYPTPLKFENKINEIGAVVIEGVEEKVVAVRTFKGFVTQQESEVRSDGTPRSELHILINTHTHTHTHNLLHAETTQETPRDP